MNRQIIEQRSELISHSAELFIGRNIVDVKRLLEGFISNYDQIIIDNTKL